MKHTCVDCNKNFELYSNFRRHLTTNLHKQKSKIIISKQDLERLDYNMQLLLNLIRSS